MILYLDLIGNMYFELEPWCPNRGGRVEGHFHSILGVLKFFPPVTLAKAPKATVHPWDKAGKVCKRSSLPAEGCCSKPAFPGMQSRRLSADWSAKQKLQGCQLSLPSLHFCMLKTYFFSPPPRPPNLQLNLEVELFPVLNLSANICICMLK